MVFVGFDPGGARAFGWAILRTAESGTQLLATGTCSCARQALDAVRAAAVQQPRALAVDAPLFWSESGDRKADQYVRRMVCSAGGSSGTVSHVNSLRGACLVQGVFITRMASLVWPHAEISEAHPKALAVVSSQAAEFLRAFVNRVASEHESDAILAAYSALNYANRVEEWRDLVALEESIFFPAGKSVAYYFPRAQT